ncbi:MAG: response regulator [Gammaproteobacteria bacterium]|nr:MAG: response regulator [Gammaproteobacteria bacterium]
MYRILLVDDEPNILSALRRSLASIDVTRLDGEAPKLVTFNSPEAALEHCEENEFDLILTDYRMPTMDGVQLLTRLMDIQPSVPRVIISGYADRDAIIAAINEAQLTRFIQKPWDDNELRETVVSILNKASKKSTAPVFRDPKAISEKRQQMLEKECPGITQIERDDDGGIWIGFEE